MCPCALTQWRVHTVSYCGVIIVNMLIIGWLGFKHTQCPPHWLDITRRPHYAFLICHSALCLVTLIGHLCRFIQTGVFSFTHFLHSSHLYSNRVFLWWNTHHMWPFVLSFSHVFSCQLFRQSLVSPRSVRLPSHAVAVATERWPFHLGICYEMGGCIQLSFFVIPFHPIHWDFICRLILCSLLGFHFVQSCRRRHPIVWVAYPLMIFLFHAVIGHFVRRLFYQLIVAVF